MRYLALIYTEEKDPSTVPPEYWAELMAAYNRYEDDIKAAAVKLAGEALQPTQTATTVRVRDGRVVTTDGPFAETKEALGGFYMFECKDLDEAIEWASRIPDANTGSIEVRPIQEFTPEELSVGRPEGAAAN
jgi:hypothetical protein